MKLLSLGIGLAVLLGASVYAFLPKQSAQGGTKEESLVFNATTAARLTKITPHPLHMSEAVAMMCASTPLNGNSPHSNKYFDVYISNPQAPVIETGTGTYPEGCVILKRKYSDPNGKNTELFTGMVKHVPGYNPTSGDWEYFVLSGDGTHVDQSGQIRSCMACHQAYSASDFVTREYFKRPAAFTTGPVSW